MIHATILRVDDSVLVENVAIEAQNAKRGTGDGHVWRGVYLTPGIRLRPTTGETITVRLNDQVRLQAVVTEVAGPRVHFRARGLAPKVEADRAATFSAE